MGIDQYVSRELLIQIRELSLTITQKLDVITKTVHACLAIVIDI